MSDFNQCAGCKERGRPANFASEPRCAFTNGTFSDNNWQCVTALAVRDICDEWGNDLPKGVTHTWYEDENYATILIPIEVGRPDDHHFGDLLYVQWYKSRGCTSEMWLLGSIAPRQPTEAQCLAIIDYYQPLLDKIRGVHN